MPKTFRLRPKTDQEKFFRPPSRIQREEKRVSRWSEEYKEARGVRNSGRWKKLRDRMVRQNPVCERCSVAPSADVHHIQPLVEGLDGAYSRRNLICLCRNCHDIAHNRDRMNDPIREELEQITNKREDQMEK